MIQYRKAVKADEANILDFINMVFSQNAKPHDFSKLLGKVYGHPGFSDIHYLAAEEDGHVLATVALLPMDLYPDTETKLKLGYVGSVSVHGYHRGEGHMKRVMKDMLEDAKARDFDILSLNGRRQRYQYFGFESTGCGIQFSINEANVRHALKQVDIEPFELHEVQENETELLEAIYQMAQNKPFRCRWERSRLWDILHSWYGNAYGFLMNGKMIGYILTTDEGSISEYGLSDITKLEALIKTWMQNRKCCEVYLPLYDRVAVSMLRRFSESFSVYDNGMYRILNWKHVLEVLLRERSEAEPLMDGRFVFEIENAGSYVIEAKNGCVSVSETNEEAEVKFTENKAVEFFFSPYTALTVRSPMLKSWLPLPLYLSMVDTF